MKKRNSDWRDPVFVRTEDDKPVRPMPQDRFAPKLFELLCMVITLAVAVALGMLAAGMFV